jgi:EmrB/QacA subfamily drug resistance transporter
VAKPAARRRLVLVATILGSSMAFLDASVVNVALPTIEKDLDLGLAGEQWIFLGYSVALAALYLPAGALGDRYGYVTIFAGGVIGFAAASALAGAAPTGEVLIAARVIQGVFGALLTPSSLALLRATYGAESGRAIGSWTAWTGITTVAGPPVGGAIVQGASWRWIFFLNLPLAVVTVVAVLRVRDTCRTETRERRLDVAGAVLAAVGIGSLVWALVEGPEQGFGAPAVVAGFVVAAAALTTFFVVETHVAEPMLPLSLFRIRELAVANAATLFVYGALGGSMFFIVLFVQSVLGYSPFEAGFVLAPVSLVLFLLASRFGRMADRLGPRPFLIAGPVGIGIGLFFLARLNHDSDYWTDVLPPLLVFSVGLAATVPPITATALKAAPDHLSGIASGVNTTISRLGQLLAVALLGLVVALVYDAPGTPLEQNQRDPKALAESTQAYEAAMWGAAGLAFVGAAVAALGLPRTRRAARSPRRSPAPPAT